MAEVVNGGTRLTPVERDYVIGRLSSSDGAQDFANATSALSPDTRLDWLLWLETYPPFRELFVGHEGDQASNALGHWFCSSFIAEPEMHGAALQTVQRLGQRFGTYLFFAAGMAAEQLGDADPAAGRRWKVLLATSIPGQSSPADPYFLRPYFPGLHAEPMSVLRAALRPRISLKRHWSFTGEDDPTRAPDADVGWIEDEVSLSAHLTKAVEGAAPGDPVLGVALEDGLNAAYDLLDAYHDSREWDELSFSRSAVEPHPQDEFRESIDAVIDALRLYGEKGISHRGDLAERWWEFGRGLFQRLAVHVVASDDTRRGDDKIQWLLERPEPFSSTIKHEAFRLIGLGIAPANDSTRADLLTSALTDPDLPGEIPDRDRHAAYIIYNRLVWLTENAPTWQEAQAALATLQSQYPYFRQREHPDFDRWMSSGTWVGAWPMEPDAFIEAFAEQPAVALAAIINRDYGEHHFEGPEWADALRLLSDASSQHPGIGLRIWDMLEANLQHQQRRAGVERALIEGWARAELGDNGTEVVQRVARHLTDGDSSRVIGDFLEEQGRAHMAHDESPLMADLRKLARGLWREQRSGFEVSDGYDPLSAAPLYLNSWPGDLAQFWTSEIDRRWRSNRNDWSGLSEEEQGAILELLGGPEATLQATVPAIASQLFFLFAADADFATRHVLPLFSNDSTSNLAWHAYLHSPRYNDRLLASGLFECVLSEWDQLNALRDQHLRAQFFGLVTSILSFAGITAEERGLLLDRSVLARGGQYAADFASAVVSFLGSEGVDAVGVWELWLRAHIEARVDGIPRNADPDELTQWADAVLAVGVTAMDVLSLFAGRDISLGTAFRTPAISDEVFAQHGPELADHFVERLRKTPNEPLMSYRVQRLVDYLEARLDSADLAPLLEAARRFGVNSSSGDPNGGEAS